MKRTRLRGVVLAVTLTAAVVVGFAEGASAGEGEYRGFLGAGWRAGQSSVRLALELRSEAAIDRLYYVAPSVGVERSAGEHLLVSADYAMVRTKSGEEWTTEHRPYVELTLKAEMLGLALSDRNRAELRVREGDESTRYRNRLRLVRGMGRSGLRVFVDDEVFIPIELGEADANRATAGVEMPLGSGLRFSAFYVVESRKTSDGWADVHCVASSVSKTF